jgi:SAM-dependent methyltransferase
MTSTLPETGSARRWGPLWGSHPADWAEIEEGQVPLYEEAIRRVGIAPGQRVLEVGCGTGVFLKLAADRGAETFGLDASEALLELAATRVPAADLTVGDMQFLPYEDDSFDLVAGFNAFFFAEDMVAALREAGRVARPGADVVIQVWGPPERNDLEAMKQVMRRFAPPPPPGSAGPGQFSDPGVLEAMASAAGLEPESAFDFGLTSEFPDDETLGRLMLAPMGLAALVGAEREDEVRREIVDALAPYRREDGSYRLANEYRFVIARAA